MNLGNKCFLKKYVKGRIKQIKGNVLKVESNGVPMDIPVENPEGYTPNEPVVIQPPGVVLDPPMSPPSEEEEKEYPLFRIIRKGKIGNFSGKFYNYKNGIVKQNYDWDAVEYFYLAINSNGKIVGTLQLVNEIPGVTDPSTSSNVICDFIPPEIEEYEFEKPGIKTYTKTPYVVSTNILPNTKPLTENYEKGYNDILLEWGHQLKRADGYNVNIPNVITEDEARHITNSIIIGEGTQLDYSIDETLEESSTFWAKSTSRNRQVNLIKEETDEEGNIQNTYDTDTIFYEDEFNYFNGIKPNEKFSGIINTGGYLAGLVTKYDSGLSGILESIIGSSLDVGSRHDVAAIYYPNTIEELEEAANKKGIFDAYIDSCEIKTVYEIDDLQFENVSDAEFYAENNELDIGSIVERNVSSAFIDVETGKYVETITDELLQLYDAKDGTLQLYNCKKGLHPILDYTGSNPVIINYNQFVYRDSILDILGLTTEGYTDESEGLPNIPDYDSKFFGFLNKKNFLASGNYATFSKVVNNGMKIKKMTNYSIEDFMQNDDNKYRKLLDLDIPNLEEINKRMEKGEEPFDLEDTDNLDEKLDYLTFTEAIKSSPELKNAFRTEGDGSFASIISTSYNPKLRENPRDYILYDDKQALREFFYTPEEFPEEPEGGYDDIEERPLVSNIKGLDIFGNKQVMHTFMLDTDPSILTDEETEETFDNEVLSTKLFYRDFSPHICYETNDGIVVVEIEKYNKVENEKHEFPRIDDENPDSSIELSIPYIIEDKMFDTMAEAEAYCANNSLDTANIHQNVNLHNVTVSYESYGKGEILFTEGVDYEVDYVNNRIKYLESDTENWGIGYYEIILFDDKIEDDTFDNEVIPIYLVNGEEFETFENAKAYCELDDTLSITDIIIALKVWIFNEYFINYEFLPILTDDQKEDKMDESIKLRGYDFYTQYGSKYFGYMSGTSDNNPPEGEEGHIPEDGYKLQKYDLALNELSEPEIFDDFTTIKIGDLEIEIEEQEDRTYKFYKRFPDETRSEILSDLITEYSNFDAFTDLNIENYLKGKINAYSFINDSNELIDYYYLVHELDNEYIEDNEDALFYIYCFNTDEYKVVKGYPVIATLDDTPYIYSCRWDITDTKMYLIDGEKFDTVGEAQIYCDGNNFEYSDIKEYNEFIPDNNTVISDKLFILRETIEESEESVNLNGYELYKDSFFNKYDYTKGINGFIINTDEELLEYMVNFYGDIENDDYIEHFDGLEIDKSSIVLKDNSIEKLTEYTYIYYTVSGESFSTEALAQEYCNKYDIDYSEIVEVQDVADIKGTYKEKPITIDGKVLSYLDDSFEEEDVSYLPAEKLFNIDGITMSCNNYPVHYLKKDTFYIYTILHLSDYKYDGWYLCKMKKNNITIINKLPNNSYPVKVYSEYDDKWMIILEFIGEKDFGVGSKQPMKRVFREYIPKVDGKFKLKYNNIVSNTLTFNQDDDLPTYYDYDGVIRNQNTTSSYSSYNIGTIDYDTGEIELTTDDWYLYATYIYKVYYEVWTIDKDATEDVGAISKSYDLPFFLHSNMGVIGMSRELIFNEEDGELCYYDFAVGNEGFIYRTDIGDKTSGNSNYFCKNWTCSVFFPFPQRGVHKYTYNGYYSKHKLDLYSYVKVFEDYTLQNYEKNSWIIGTCAVSFSSCTADRYETSIEVYHVIEYPYGEDTIRIEFNEYFTMWSTQYITEYNFYLNGVLQGTANQDVKLPGTVVVEYPSYNNYTLNSQEFTGLFSDIPGYFNLNCVSQSIMRSYRYDTYYDGLIGSMDIFRPIFIKKDSSNNKYLKISNIDYIYTGSTGYYWDLTDRDRPIEYDLNQFNKYYDLNNNSIKSYNIIKTGDVFLHTNYDYTITDRNVYLYDDNEIKKYVVNESTLDLINSLNVTSFINLGLDYKDKIGYIYIDDDVKLYYFNGKLEDLSAFSNELNLSNIFNYECNNIYFITLSDAEEYRDYYNSVYGDLLSITAVENLVLDYNLIRDNCYLLRNY